MGTDGPARRVQELSMRMQTRHMVHLGDARDLSWLADASVHLVVTSPPYGSLKGYPSHPDQPGNMASYEEFLVELDKGLGGVLSGPSARWPCRLRRRGRVHLGAKAVVTTCCLCRRTSRCARAPSGSTPSRPSAGSRSPTSLWRPPGRAASQGKPNLPNRIVKNDLEHILFCESRADIGSRRPRRSATHASKPLSTVGFSRRSGVTYRGSFVATTPRHIRWRSRGG